MLIDCCRRSSVCPGKRPTSEVARSPAASCQTASDRRAHLVLGKALRPHVTARSGLQDVPGILLRELATTDQLTEHERCGVQCVVASACWSCPYASGLPAQYRPDVAIAVVTR